jgi:hypothetical protein
LKQISEQGIRKSKYKIGKDCEILPKKRPQIVQESQLDVTLTIHGEYTYHCVNYYTERKGRVRDAPELSNKNIHEVRIFFFSFKVHRTVLARAHLAHSYYMKG